MTRRAHFAPPVLALRGPWPMTRSSRSPFASIALLAALLAHVAIASPVAQSPAPAAAAMPPERMRQTMQQYCVSCHSDRLKTGGLSLEGIDYADAGPHAEPLEKAVRKLLVGAMPPLGVPRPVPAELQALRKGLETALDRAAARS